MPQKMNLSKLNSTNRHIINQQDILSVRKSLQECNEDSPTNQRITNPPLKMTICLKVRNPKLHNPVRENH